MGERCANRRLGGASCHYRTEICMDGIAFAKWLALKQVHLRHCGFFAGVDICGADGREYRSREAFISLQKVSV